MTDNPQIAPQANPVANTGASCWDLVIADMRERDRFGRAKYGTPLQAHNGRDPLVDAYQEALDLAVYLRQAIEERKSGPDLLKALRAASNALRSYQYGNGSSELAEKVADACDEVIKGASS